VAIQEQSKRYATPQRREWPRLLRTARALRSLCNVLRRSSAVTPVLAPLRNIALPGQRLRQM